MSSALLPCTTMAVMVTTFAFLLVCNNTISFALPSPSSSTKRTCGGAASSPHLSLTSRRSSLSSSSSTLQAVVTKTTIPPLINVPTYSMATCNNIDDDDDASCTTNMNILTYATPVSVHPDRVFSIGIYKETLSYINFCRTRSCVLQLLTEKHIALVKLLGGSSGMNVNKQMECEKLGFAWSHLPSSSPPDGNDNEDKTDDKQQLPMILPDCAYYLRFTAMGDIIDCGSHVVAICKVQEMFVANDNLEHYYPHLSTARLRELGIITDQGRVAD